MVYGENTYGRFLYGADTSSEQETVREEYYKDLEHYVPPFIYALTEMDAIYKAQGYEVGRAWHNYDDLSNQFFVDTATWGITRWEELYGITASDLQTIEQRRNTVKARMRGTETCTRQLVKDLAEKLSGVTVRVTEDSPNFTFTVFFIGQYGIPKNIKALKEQLEIIKPAHLAYILQYRYVIWNELAEFTWNDLKVYTWDGIRIMGVITATVWNTLVSESYTWRSAKAHNWNNIKEINQ